MISICMSTYNGERFIYEQLECIYNQSLPADEVVICDDCSSDKTVEIIEQFINKYGLCTTWKLYKNDCNKGYPQNFYYSMSLCQGDIVFLADQDDLWKNNKIENMVKVMNANENIGLLASRWGIIDQNDKILKEVSRGKCIGTEECVSINVRDILYCYDWPGMSMCYRKDVGKLTLERAGESKLAHDMALGLVAAEKECFYCVDQINQYHRRHNTNVAMEEHRIKKLLSKKRKMCEIERYLRMLENVLDSGCLKCENTILVFNRKKEIMQERMNNLQKGYRMRMIKQYMKQRQDIRIATVACDLIICRQKED